MPDLRVLIPLDGSALAEASLRYLPLLAREAELSVLLFSVCETFADRATDEVTLRQQNLLTAYLEKAAAERAKAHVAEVEVSVSLGVAHVEILKAAQQFAADLILTTTHGRSGLGRWRVGSVADKVIRGASCDMLVVGPASASRVEAPQVRAVLAPLDGSELAEAALGRAVSIASSLGASLHLVRVVTIPVTGGEVTAYAPDMLDVLQDAATTYFGSLPQRVSLPEGVRTAVLVGPVSEELRAYSEAHGVGLVVMTSHGRHGLLRTALGSVTDRMLSGPAPVWVVRAK